MLYKINWEDAMIFERWAKENQIQYEELDEDNYLDACPKCGEYEFWHEGHCGNCGFDI